MQQEMYMQYYKVCVFERDKGNRGKAKREWGREKEVEKKDIRTNEKREGKKACLGREMVLGTHSRKFSKVTKICLKS